MFIDKKKKRDRIKGCNFLTRYVWVCAKRKRERRQERETRNKNLVDERKRKRREWGRLQKNVRPPGIIEVKKQESDVCEGEEKEKGKRDAKALWQDCGAGGAQ